MRSIEGTIIQPIIGAWSDHAWTRLGRRKPFMLIALPLSCVFLALTPFTPGLAGITVYVIFFSFFFNIASNPYTAGAGGRLRRVEDRCRIHIRILLLVPDVRHDRRVGLSQHLSGAIGGHDIPPYGTTAGAGSGCACGGDSGARAGMSDQLATATGERLRWSGTPAREGSHNSTNSGWRACERRTATCRPYLNGAGSISYALETHALTARGLEEMAFVAGMSGAAERSARPCRRGGGTARSDRSADAAILFASLGTARMDAAKAVGRLLTIKEVVALTPASAG